MVSATEPAQAYPQARKENGRRPIFAKRSQFLDIISIFYKPIVSNIPACAAL
jgi:hypothetical protein